jgi:type III secretion system low calcium response chaperone LcrH/SycD
MSHNTETNKLTENDINKALEDVLNGKPVYEVAGWSQDQIDALYSAAYNQYRAGAYEEALNIFKPLLVLNSTDSRVWLGYAAAAQMLNNHEDALKAYGYASLLDPMDARPFFHAMECHIALKNYDEAKTAGEYVVGVTTDKPEHSKTLARTQILLKAIEEKLVA